MQTYKLPVKCQSANVIFELFFIPAKINFTFMFHLFIFLTTLTHSVRNLNVSLNISMSTMCLCDYLSFVYNHSPVCQIRINLEVSLINLAYRIGWSIMDYMTLLWGKQSQWWVLKNLTFINSSLVTSKCPPDSKSYLSYIFIRYIRLSNGNNLMSYYICY